MINKLFSQSRIVKGNNSLKEPGAPMVGQLLGAFQQSSEASPTSAGKPREVAIAMYIKNTFLLTKTILLQSFTFQSNT